MVIPKHQIVIAITYKWKVGGHQASKQQKEAMKIQLEKESKIREEVAKSDYHIRPILDFLLAAVDANPAVFEMFATSLERSLESALKSPLTAEKASSIIKSLGKSA